MNSNKLNNYTVYLMLIILFNTGLLEILGIPPSYLRLFIELLIFILVINIFFKKLTWFFPSLLCALLLIYLLVSFLVTDSNIIPFVLFFRRLFFPLLFLLSLKNMKKIEEATINKLLNILFVEQIIASIIKLFSIGQTEAYIGTISVFSGELATIFPLMAITFYFTKYLYYENYKYLIICPFFLIIPYSSLKLGIIVYLPIVLIFNYLLIFFSKGKSKKYFVKFVKQAAMYCSIAAISFYFLVRLNPRANIEHKVWGSFDLEYVIDSTILYTTRDRYVENEQKSGRFTAISLYLSDLKYKSIKNFLFGEGPGSLIKSGIVHSDRDDFVADYGYGSKVGIIWFIEQIGILGLAIYILIQLSILRVLNNSYNTLYSFCGKIFFFIIILDLFTYSSVSVISQFPLIIYFIIVCIAAQNSFQIKQQQLSNKGTLIT